MFYWNASHINCSDKIKHDLMFPTRNPNVMLEFGFLALPDAHDMLLNLSLVIKEQRFKYCMSV